MFAFNVKSFIGGELYQFRGELENSSWDLCLLKGGYFLEILTGET